ncbi:unnamed protein product [Rotaria sordida]|uniref:Uncharacterized protein n=2 Tax=Rotaria sordida TaxID=392033 RepID=A0A815C1I7_9BILA|nr:unnamed protein product [Rotaria sordida]CAF4043009.1 unnamed protein product [Rotaria sordida]
MSKIITSEIPYTTLTETNSTSRGSITTLDSLDSAQYVGNENIEHSCRICKSKLIKKQQPDHTPIECLGQRCQILEAEKIKLKDHDIKSRIQIEELENKITMLEDAIKGLTAPKQLQAAPFNFIDISTHEPEINYDNILPPKRSNSRERVGLFGSLGAASQYPHYN